MRVYPINIFISEFLPVPPEGKSGWVELYNGADYVADLSGWGVGVSKNTPEFTLPENTFLAAHGFLVLPEDMLGLTLPHSGELSLWYPHGQAARRIMYRAPAQGFSIALNGNNQFVATASATPGTRNVLTASGYAAAPSSAVSASGIKKENKSLVLPVQVVKDAPAESFTLPAVVAESFTVSAENGGQQDKNIAPVALVSRAFGSYLFFDCGSIWILLWLAFRRRPVPVAEGKRAIRCLELRNHNFTPPPPAIFL